MFHKHQWKEIARTYAPNMAEIGVRSARGFISKIETHGQTTILWECKDKDCQKLRKEEMLGK